MGQCLREVKQSIHTHTHIRREVNTHTHTHREVNRDIHPFRHPKKWPNDRGLSSDTSYFRLVGEIHSKPFVRSAAAHKKNFHIATGLLQNSHVEEKCDGFPWSILACTLVQYFLPNNPSCDKWRFAIVSSNRVPRCNRKHFVSGVLLCVHVRKCDSCACSALRDLCALCYTKLWMTKFATVFDQYDRFDFQFAVLFFLNVCLCSMLSASSNSVDVAAKSFLASFKKRSPT